METTPPSTSPAAEPLPLFRDEEPCEYLATVGRLVIWRRTLRGGVRLAIHAQDTGNVVRCLDVRSDQLEGVGAMLLAQARERQERMSARRPQRVAQDGRSTPRPTTRSRAMPDASAGLLEAPVGWDLGAVDGSAQ